MALTAEQRKHVTQILDAFCDSRVPIAVRDKIVLQYRFKGSQIAVNISQDGVAHLWGYYIRFCSPGRERRTA